MMRAVAELVLGVAVLGVTLGLLLFLLLLA